MTRKIVIELTPAEAINLAHMAGEFADRADIMQEQFPNARQRECAYSGYRKLVRACRESQP